MQDWVRTHSEARLALTLVRRAGEPPALSTAGAGCVACGLDSSHFTCAKAQLPE